MKTFNVSDYVTLLENRGILVKCSENISSILDKKVKLISYNSKDDVVDGTMFLCKGSSFKEEYLADTIKRGVFLYVSETEYENVDIPYMLVSDIRSALSLLSCKYFSYPACKLNLIAITGTKGKSTTSYFVKYILDAYAKEQKKMDTAIISSIYTYDGKEKYKSKLTTPESFDLQRNLYNASESGIENVVMETSSQALKYGRVDNLKFDISAFLNISEDHISPVEHNDFEDYFSSKLKIFEKSNVTCVNLDMDFADRVIKEAKEKVREVYTFSCKNKEAYVYGTYIRKFGLYTIFDIVCDKYIFQVTLSMPGFFNVENALAAITIAFALNIPINCIVEGLKVARSEGRMEIYHSKDEKILSIVDYAHNKMSFEKIFDTTKKEYPERKIITVFGCPGNKAQIRRKDLGEIAGKNSDYIYLTADDPAYETVEGICEEISKFAKDYTDDYEIVLDRKEAIEKAVKKILKCNDSYILLLLGKGNETTQKVGSGYEDYLGDSFYIQKYIQEYENNNLKE